MINILVFNISLHIRAEEREKLFTYSKFIKMILSDFE
jgi:hypothetical protein